MEDLVEPMQDQLLDNKDHIQQLHQENKKQNNRFDDLRETIFNTKGKLDVFEQISLKIADGAAKTKTLKDEVTFIKKQVNTKMDQVMDDNKTQVKIFNNLQDHSRSVMDELSKLKELYTTQSESFIERLKETNE